MESSHDDINGSPTISDMLERMTQNHAEAALAVLNDNRPRGAQVVPVDEVENLTPMMIAFFGLVQTMLGAYTLPQLKVLGGRDCRQYQENDSRSECNLRIYRRYASTYAAGSPESSRTLWNTW